MTGIINKPLLLHLVGCLYHLYQWCTVKQISDNEIYLLIKYIKSILWRVAKCLSYIEEARCLKVNCGTGRQQRRCIVPKAVYTVKKCSWGWTNLSHETFWADLKTLINEKVVASFWLFTSLNMHFFCLYCLIILQRTVQ